MHLAFAFIYIAAPVSQLRLVQFPWGQVATSIVQVCRGERERGREERKEKGEEKKKEERKG